MATMSRRRAQPRPKPPHASSTDAAARYLPVSALIFTLCLCAFNFDLNGNTHTRLDTCRATCDERLQTAALESTVSSSLTPSAMDTLFLSKGTGQKPAHQDRASDDGQATHLKPTQPHAAVTGRPRRLPTLIKILTGFGDEPYWNEQGSSSTDSSGNSRPIIARIERPQFVNQAQKRRRGTSTEQTSHEDTVQMAAAAAAAAVWSKSIRIFGNNRMQRVNSEWDAALRWIAGWDQQQHMPSTLDTGNGSGPMRSNDGQSVHGGAPNDVSQEGFDNFVDDLARMLETCIRQCVDDEHFESRLGHDEGPGEVAAAGSSIVDLVLRSLFGWVVGSSFSSISFGKLDMMSSQSRTVVSRAFQVAASSVAVYAFRSLWILASPVLSHWYSSLGYTESPEWLVEHEREIKHAKSSSRRQKKKARRRQMSKQSGSRAQQAQSRGGAQKAGGNAKDNSGGADPKLTRSANTNEQAPEPSTITVKPTGTASSDGWPQERPAPENAESTAPTSSKDSASEGSSTTDDVPSMISYSSTLASWSPPLKPIGSHLGNVQLQGPTQPVLGLSSQLPAPTQGPMFPPLPNAVPTQEQRNEAAKQLREFQNAQIQRLVLQRKLSQASTGNSDPSTTNTPAPQASSGLLNPGISFQSSSSSVGASSIMSPPIQPEGRVLKPPPGLPHPSEIPYKLTELQKHEEDSKGFLTDNELFLSKLLDDDDYVEETKATPSLQIDIDTLCPEPESSLDPSAAPFVGKAGGGELGGTLIANTSKDGNEEDAWQSGNGGDVSLKENSPSKMIKGVYGGSVW